MKFSVSDGDHLTWSVYFALKDGEVNADNVNVHVGVLEIAIKVYKACAANTSDAVGGNAAAIASMKAGDYAGALVHLYHL